MQIKTENKRKLISTGVTVLFHIILVLLLFAFGLPYQDPPPPEQGVEISAGDLTDVGNALAGETGGEESPEANTDSEQSEDENYSSQTTEDVPISAKPVSSVKKNTKKEEKPKVQQEALFPGKKSSGGKGEGSGTGYGSGENGTGGGGNGTNTSGTGFSLNGRSKKYLPEPKTNKKEVGNVVVEIKVNQEGSVVSAVGGVKGTTIMDNNLWRVCEQAARRAKFSAKEDAPELQRGTITYHFVL